MELNKGHKEWLDTGKATLEEVEECQRKTDETIKKGNEFLLQKYFEELEKPNPNQEVLLKLEKYLKSKNLI